MSQADELLNQLSESGISLQLANPETEPHIVVGEDRFISVPKELQRIAVQYDHDVETVTFDCPRYWDGLDMSKLYIYINYMRKDRVYGCYKATDISVDEADDTIMHFNWTISRNVSEAKGELKFLVCIKKADEDGNEKNHWNSELNTEMYVSEGLETGEIVLSSYPDVISQWEEDVQRVKDILLAARDAGELNGATFTPSVDLDGNLSWTNDKGRENPATVNIKGYSPAILVREIEGGRELIITDSRQSQTVKIMDGADGYSPAILVREIEGGKELVITDYRQSQTVTIKDGVDGYSPAILVKDIDGGKQLVITDYRQSQTVDILNGVDGTDGYNPTVTTEAIDGGNRITFTDKDGPKSIDIINGTNGTDGYSPAILVREIDGGKQLVITDYRQSQTVTIKDGVDGTNGTNGVDGYSPTVATQAIEGGNRVTITDKDGPKSVDIMDGTDGTDGNDGYSPTVTVTDINGGHRVTITDANGSKTFDVMNGTQEISEAVKDYINTYMYIGETEPTSGPVLWFDTAPRSAG